MTGKIDFKAAKARAEDSVNTLRDVKLHPLLEQESFERLHDARAYLAVCELLLDQFQYVEHQRVKHRECPGCNEMAKCTCGLKEILERVEAIGE